MFNIHTANRVAPTQRVIDTSTRIVSTQRTVAVYEAVAPSGGKVAEASPLWVDVQKLCNMYVLSLSWNFFVSHDKYIARPSSKEPRRYTDSTSGIGRLRTLDPL